MAAYFSNFEHFTFSAILREWRGNVRCLSWPQFDPKFQVEGVASHQPLFFEKTRINVLSYGIKMSATFITIHVFDGRAASRGYIAFMQCMQRGKTISCIMEMIQFAEYILFQLWCISKQLINIHNLFLRALSRIYCIVHKDVLQDSVGFTSSIIYHHHHLIRSNQQNNVHVIPRNATCNSDL